MSYPPAKLRPLSSAEITRLYNPPGFIGYHHHKTSTMHQLRAEQTLHSAYPDEHAALDTLIDRLPPAISNNILWSSFTDTDYFIVFATDSGDRKVEVRIPKSWDITSDEAVAKICLEAP